MQKYFKIFTLLVSFICFQVSFVGADSPDIKDTPLWGLLSQQERGLQEVNTPGARRLLGDYAWLKRQLPLLEIDVLEHLGSLYKTFGKIVHTTYQSGTDIDLSFKHLWKDLCGLWSQLRCLPTVDRQTQYLILRLRCMVLILSTVLSDQVYMLAAIEGNLGRLLSKEEQADIVKKIGLITGNMPIKKDLSSMSMTGRGESYVLMAFLGFCLVVYITSQIGIAKAMKKQRIPDR